MARKRKKDRYGLGGEVQFQMAPLIDCVFLLLIFFISVTTFHKAENVDLQLAYAQTAEEFKKGRDTFVVNVTQAGEIWANGRHFLTKNALQNFMQGLVDQSGTGWKVAIRGDQNAREKEIKDVYRAAARVGLTRIAMVTQTRPEDRPTGGLEPVPAEEKSVLPEQPETPEEDSDLPDEEPGEENVTD